MCSCRLGMRMRFQIKPYWECQWDIMGISILVHALLSNNSYRYILYVIFASRPQAAQSFHARVQSRLYRKAGNCISLRTNLYTHACGINSTNWALCMIISIHFNFILSCLFANSHYIESLCMEIIWLSTNFRPLISDNQSHNTNCTVTVLLSVCIRI